MYLEQFIDMWNQIQTNIVSLLLNELNRFLFCWHFLFKWKITSPVEIHNFICFNQQFKTWNCNSGGWWFFFTSIACDYSLNDMMKWTRHKLCRQRAVPSHWLQTKLDTSAHWCSTTSHNIMTARQLSGCTEVSSPLIFYPSIHLLACVWLGWGQRSSPSLWSKCVTPVYVYVKVSVTVCGTKSIQPEGSDDSVTSSKS